MILDSGMFWDDGPLPSLLRLRVGQRTEIQRGLGDLIGEETCTWLLRGTPVFPQASATVAW